MELTNYEKQRIENRAHWHWVHDCQQYQASTWRDYWKANRKQCMKNGKMFKRVLSAQGFERYLTDFDVNPWTIHNIETLNG